MPLVALACAIAPLAVGLGGWALFEPDEGRNAEIAREMLATGDWLVPHLNGVPFLDKPPLLFWMIATAFRWLGQSEAVARLPSALAAIVTVAGTYGLGRALLDGRRAATAALVLATAPMVLVFGRLVIFDMPLTACVTVALYAMVRSRLDGDPWRWLPRAGLAWGAALLAKGPVGLVVPVVVWVSARGALPGGRAPAARPAGGIAFLVAAAMIGAWIAGVMPREPGFLRYAVVEETLLRVASTRHFHRGGPAYYYLLTVPWALGIWMVPLAALGPSLVRRAHAGGPDAPAIGFATRSAAAIVVFFTLSASKRPQYVLPALPPLALLIAIGMGVRPRLTARVFRVTGWIAAGIGCIALTIAVTAGAPTRIRTDLPVPEMWQLAGVILVAWGLVTARGARRPGRAVVLGAAFAPLLILGLVRPLATYAERRSARRLAASVPAGAPVVCFDTFRTSLPFYLKRSVTVVSDRGRVLTSNYVASRRRELREPTLRFTGALNEVLAGDPVGYVVVARGQAGRLRGLAPGYRFAVVAHDRRSTLLRATAAPGSGPSSGRPDTP